MIGQHKNPVITEFVDILDHGSDGETVKILNGPNFLIEATFVTGLIRCLNMDIDKIPGFSMPPAPPPLYPGNRYPDNPWLRGRQ